MIQPVEAWTNGRHGTVLAHADRDRVRLVLPSNEVVEFDARVFRLLALRMVVGASIGEDSPSGSGGVSGRSVWKRLP